MTLDKVHTELLFSYGTLQLETVQITMFGRRLTGTSDALHGFELVALRIDDPKVVDISGKAVHTMARFTGLDTDVISGMVFEVTANELLKTDDYEVSAVKRVEVALESGARAWAYVGAQSTPEKS